MALRFLISCVAAAALLGSMASAEAQAPRKRGLSASPNSSYMVGPRTRVYVTRRSWLDAGTEVLPGERKFTDYVIPPGYNFADQIDPRGGWRRQPLPDPWDLPGRSYSGF